MAWMHREQSELAHALEVREDPLAVHRDALEPRVEAERDQAELGDGTVDLRERSAPSRGSTMPHATGNRSGVASRYAAISSLTRRVSAMPLGRR